MVRMPKCLYQQLYKRILVEALPKAMTEYDIVVKDTTLQNDNDPKHTSMTVKEQLSGQLFSVSCCEMSYQ
jgi:hypothetical protein